MASNRQMDSLLIENVLQFVDEMEKLFYQTIKKDNPTIIIHAGFGQNNTGDDSLMLTARQLIRKIYPNAKIIALGHNPKHGIDKYPVETGDMIPVKFKSFKMLKYIFTCDGYLVGGGGLSHDLYHKSKIKNLLEPRGKFSHIMMAIQNLRRKPVVVLFCGYHSAPDAIQKIIMRFALKKVPLLGVRDYHSGEYLQQIGINNYIVGHDPVFLYRCNDEMLNENVIRNYGLKGRDYILINVRRVVDKAISENVIHELGAYILKLHTQFPQYSFVFQPYSVRDFNAENDVTYAQAIVNWVAQRDSSVHIIALQDYQTVYDVKVWAKNAKMMLLARHHALILTYEYNVPTIALSFGIKLRGLAEYAGYHSIVDYKDITAERLMEETSKLEEQYGAL